MELNKTSEDISSMVSKIQAGGRKVLAEAITLVENELSASKQLLRHLTPKNIPVLGFTGPPGAGKSTLINSFLRHLLTLNKKAAVVAVDPTSPFNFGSLLADRLRMSEHFNNENIFIRSVASRGSLGGLSEKIIEITDVLRSSDFDYILIETVGVGQSEVEIAGLADTTIVILVPESGDDIQTMKSGIMEIADIFIVNKSDREGAEILASHLKKMLSRQQDKFRSVPVINTIAISGSGIPELYDSITSREASQSLTEKKLYLLTEKAYQIARNYKMRDLRREDIREKLEKALKERTFNLYNFVDQLIK